MEPNRSPSVGEAASTGHRKVGCAQTSMSEHSSRSAVRPLDRRRNLGSTSAEKGSPSFTECGWIMKDGKQKYI